MKKDLTFVAVYGTLRKDFGNHYLVENSRFVGYAQGKFWATMYCNGGFPVLCLEEPDSKPEVEIYEVDEVTLARLDRLEGYPSWYSRDLKTFSIAGEEIKAYIYHQRDDQIRKEYVTVVEGGDWADHIKKKRGAA
jgi:gamma-glutamylaminecyclotransferase